MKTSNMNYILFAFSLATTIMIFLSSLINFFEKQLPICVRQSFRYGKFADNEKCSIFSKFNIEVPKSWFKHFYVLALICYILTFTTVTSVYFLKYEVSDCIVNLLNLVCGDGRVSFVSPTQAYVAVCLLTLQVFRRFHDTHFVSVFSKNGYINFHHYIVGIAYYPGTALAILCEAPKFAQASPYAAQDIDFLTLSYFEWFAVILFLWAWWHQYIATEILANLRKNKKGTIVTNDHKLPHGDWFEYISSPAQGAEIMMYTALTIILRYNITWFFVYTFVVANQIETMLLSHWWYQETFKDFPKNRKVLIPFIY